MFLLDHKIPDTHHDEIGESLKRINSLSRWTKEKQEARANLIFLLKKNGYISFCGHVDKYHLSCVGESCLYEIPESRRGHLKVFRGKIIRLVCVRSGRYDRLYMAGVIQ